MQRYIRPTVSVSAVAILLAFASIGISRPPPGDKTVKARLDDIAWMVGHWAGDEGEFAEETWNAPRGGSMAGMCRIGAEGSKALYELLLIEEKGDSLTMSLRHFGPALTSRDKETLAFDLVRTGPSEIVFERMEKGSPVRVTYRSEDSKNGLYARVEKQRDGKPVHFDFRYKRLK